MNKNNVFINGITQGESVYQTIILSSGLDFADQIAQPNAKYVLKWNFNLDGKTVEFPEDCLLEFDGGSLSNGTLIGNETVIISYQENDVIFRDVNLEGTFVFTRFNEEKNQNILDSIEENIQEIQNQFQDSLDTKVDKEVYEADKEIIDEKLQTSINTLDSTIGSSDELIGITISQNSGKLTSIDIDSSNLNDRMTAYEDTVKVTNFGESLEIINTVGNIKPGSNKIPNANAISGIGRYANIKDWAYVITDSSNKVLLGIKDNGDVFANNLPTVITVSKDGSGDYTNLCEAVIKSYNRENVTIKIKKGTYDIIQEMKELYDEYVQSLYPDEPDADFWSKYKKDQKFVYPEANVFDWGLRLGSGITLIGEQGNLITCKYFGDNNNVKVDYSPFNTYVGGFKMIGLNIECSNVRYVVHDERGIDQVPYEVLYDSCYMKSNNDPLSEQWSSNACIGGGLGMYGRIEVRNCIFESQQDVNIPLVS